MKIVTICDANMLRPDVSVVIPTYNRISMLEEALASLYAQDYEGTVEIVVVDDNSRDGTPQIIRQRHPDVNLLSLPRNVGPSAARNKGISTVNGQFIAFLDSDDLWESNYLESQMALLKGTGSVDARYFGVSDVFVWEMENDKRYKKSQKPKTKYSSALHHLLSGGSFVSTPSAVVLPRQLLDEVGCFDESLRLGEDTDLYTRAVLAGYNPLFTESASVVRRKHGNEQAMTVENIGRRVQNRLKAAKNYYPLSKQQLGDITLPRIYAEIYTNFASNYYREHHYLSWIRLSLISARHSSLQAMMRNIVSDVRDSTKDFLRNVKPSVL